MLWVELKNTEDTKKYCNVLYFTGINSKKRNTCNPAQREEVSSVYYNFLSDFNVLVFIFVLKKSTNLHSPRGTMAEDVLPGRAQRA